MRLFLMSTAVILATISLLIGVDQSDGKAIFGAVGWVAVAVLLWPEGDPK